MAQVVNTIKLAKVNFAHLLISHVHQLHLLCMSAEQTTMVKGHTHNLKAHFWDIDKSLFYFPVGIESIKVTSESLRPVFESLTVMIESLAVESLPCMIESLTFESNCLRSNCVRFSIRWLCVCVSQPLHVTDKKQVFVALVKP